MLLIDKLSGKPVYEQIVEGVEKNILMGVFSPGSVLPSIRELSATLSVNPNTIQKSYAELIRRGIIIPSPGSGTYVAPDAIEKIRHAAGSKLEQLEALVAELVLADVPRSDVLATVCAVYARSEKREPIPAPIPPTGGTQS